MIKAFIFDFDGTLVNTEPIFTQAWDIIATKYNRTYDQTLKTSIMGYRALQAVEYVLEAWGIDIAAEEVLSEIDPVLLELYEKNVEPMPGWEALLNLLEHHSIAKAIATASQKHWVDTIFTKLNWQGRFSHVITAADVKHSKPHPEPFLLAAQRLKVDPKSCVALEDSSHGLESARQAGMLTIAVNNHYIGTPTLQKADIVIQSLSEIDNNLLQKMHALIESRQNHNKHA